MFLRSFMREGGKRGMHTIMQRTTPLSMHFLFFSPYSSSSSSSSSPSSSFPSVPPPSVPSSHCSPSSPVYLTLPIFYVNGPPHIGHLSTSLIADAYKRFLLLSPHLSGKQREGEEAGKEAVSVYLSGGTDEHGVKIQSSALRQGFPSPRALCDANSLLFRRLFSSFAISTDCFIRTTDEEHRQTVEAVWNRLREQGDIYLGKHEGWYDEVEEAFVPDGQIEEREEEGEGGTRGTVKVSADTGNRLTYVNEPNYLFRLSSYQPLLLSWLLSSPSSILPPSRYNEALSFLQSHPLQDISVSRLRSKLQWAWKVPGDEKHSIYVWIDALCSYLTVTSWAKEEGKATGPRAIVNAVRWPAAVQFIGKDILKFHAFIWPALLFALGLPPPSLLFVHAHWLVDGKKMSKSKGNVIDPFELIGAAASSSSAPHSPSPSPSLSSPSPLVSSPLPYPIDAVRLFLLRESPVSSDSSFSPIELERRWNEMADKMGNALNRCLKGKMLEREGEVREWAWIEENMREEDRLFVKQMNEMKDKAVSSYASFLFHSAIDDAISSLLLINRYFDEQRPWTLRSSLPSRASLICSLCLHGIRLVAIALQPIMPGKMGEVLGRMGVEEGERTWGHCRMENGGNGMKMKGGEAVMFKKIERTNGTIKREAGAHAEKQTKKGSKKTK